MKLGETGLMPAADLVQVTNLSFGYEGKKMLFENVNMQIPAGQILGLTGASGCGKSTFCYCLCGIIPHIRQGILNGKVTVCGKDVETEPLPSLVEKIGIVFQNADIQLFSDFVEEDVVFGMENLCFSWDRMDENLRRVLALLQIEPLRQRKTNQLSGGQKQLAAIASVLAMGTEVLILDEAMSQLDQEGKKALHSVITAFARQNKTVIMVEHDERNLQLADRVWDFDQGGFRA